MPFGKRTAPLPPDRFDPADWQAIITLPLQVGIWIARVDAGGGEEAAVMERAAIPAFLTTARAKFANLPLIADICVDAGVALAGVISPLQEPALMAKTAGVIKEGQAAFTLLEMNAYKLLLIEMAEYVARAAPDRDLRPHNLMRGAASGWYGLYPAILNQTMRYGRGPQVSSNEKQAINRLIDALHAGDMVKKWDVAAPDTGPGVRVYDGAAFTPSPFPHGRRISP